MSTAADARGPRTIRDSFGRLIRGRASPAIVAWVIYSVALGMLYVRVPPNPDMAIFDLIGWTACQGGGYYIDSADQNWPGAMVIHTVSTALFGNHLWSSRLLDYLWLLGTCGLLAGYCRKYFGLLPAIVVVPLYQAMYVTSGWWFTGQRDIMAASFLIMASFCLLRRREGGSGGWCAGEGFCVAAATIIRPTLLLGMPILVLCDLATVRRSGRRPGTLLRDHLIAGLAGLATAFVFAATVLGPAGLREWYTIAVRFNVEVDAWSSGERSIWVTPRIIALFAAKSWYWYLIFGTAGAVLALRTGRPLPALLLIGVAMVGVGSALAMGQETPYHLGPVLPVLGAFVSVFLAAVLSDLVRGRRRFSLLMITLTFLAIAVGGMAKKVHAALDDEIRWCLGRESTSALLSTYHGANAPFMTVQEAVELSEYVRQTVPPGQSVFVWGPTALVNYLSGRPFPGRFTSFALLASPHRGFSRYHDWAGELGRELEDQSPAIIMIFRDPEHGGYYEFFPDHTGPGFGFVVWEAVRDRYVLERRADCVDVYRLRSASTAAGSAATLPAP